MSDGAGDGDIPAEFVTFKYPLPHLAAALPGKDPPRIVAMGSSSTAGREDVVPYPARLEMYLRRAYNNPRIDVINRGVGGLEADDEVGRFNDDIFTEPPPLVIWQVGTNAVFQNRDIDKVATKIAGGLARLREQPLDVVMMDPQYVPAMLGDKADAFGSHRVDHCSCCRGRRGQRVQALGADAALARLQRYSAGADDRSDG